MVKIIGSLFLSIVAAFVFNSCILTGNSELARTADSLLGGQNVDFFSLFEKLAVLMLAGGLAAYGKSLCTGGYSARMQCYIRNKLGEKIMVLPYSFFQTKGVGSILSRLLSDLEETGRLLSEILPEFIINLITVIMISVYLVRMDGRLLVVLFVSYPFMLLIVNFLSKKLTAIAKERFSKMDERTNYAYDVIQGIEVARSFGLYEKFRRRIGEIADEIAVHAAASTKISSLAWVSKMILTQIPILICYLYALQESLTGKLTTGQLMSFVILMGKLIYPLGDLIFAVTDFRQAAVSVKRIQEVLKAEPENSGKSDFHGQDNTEKSAQSVISLKDLTFSYSAKQKVLQDVNISIAQGEKVAFVGGSGEGKSTILKILCGLYTKQQGQYFLYGQSWELWDLEEARKCFAYVSQSPILFPVSIWENIAYGKMGATKEDVIILCKRLKLESMIQKLPAGYDTIVGEHGARLSGGERQRIALARAIIKEAPIILLDEPTASVDEENEALICEAIAQLEKDKTVITVAHRLSTIQNSDQIYVLENGRITECGTHKELLAMQGCYATLYGKECREYGKDS